MCVRIQPQPDITSPKVDQIRDLVLQEQKEDLRTKLFAQSISFESKLHPHPRYQSIGVVASSAALSGILNVRDLFGSQPLQPTQQTDTSFPNHNVGQRER